MSRFVGEFTRGGGVREKAGSPRVTGGLLSGAGGAGLFLEVIDPGGGSVATMPGVISLGGKARWPATGWLYCWVVGFLAKNVVRQQLAADIDHVRAKDSGLLELEVFGPEADREMRALLRDRLVPVAEKCFPPTMRGRAPALELLRELAELATESHVDERSAVESGRTGQMTKAAYLPSRAGSAAF